MADTALFPDPRLIDLLRSMNQGMPPWEAFAWFDTPVERTVTLALAPAWTLIAPQSVRRVALLVASQSQTTVVLSTKQGGANTGFVLQTSSGPWILTQQEAGPLCQVDWFAQPGTGQLVTVIEVLLRAWPGGDPIG